MFEGLLPKNWMGYVDRLVDDSYCEEFVRKRDGLSVDNTEELSEKVQEAKMAFVIGIAQKYFNSDENWINHIYDLTDEEITAKLNQREDRTSLDAIREKLPDVSDRVLVDLLREGCEGWFYILGWSDVY